MKVLAKRFDGYTRNLTDIIYLEDNKVCWLRKSGSLDPDSLWQSNSSVLRGPKWNTWEELEDRLSSNLEEGEYITIVKTYDY